jgi:hypothetical protein
MPPPGVAPPSYHRVTGFVTLAMTQNAALRQISKMDKYAMNLKPVTGVVTGFFAFL